MRVNRQGEIVRGFQRSGIHRFVAAQRQSKKSIVHGEALSLCLAALALASIPAQAKPSKDERAMAEPAAEVAAKMRVYNDPLAEFILASTQNHRQTTGGLLSVFNVDPFVMTAIEKKTREVTYSAVFHIRYTGDWMFYSGATYDAGDGPERAKFHVMSRDVLRCQRYGCDHFEAVAVRLPQKVVDDAAAGRLTGQTWPVRLTAEKGPAYTVPVPINEIAAAKLAADRLK